MKSLTRDDTNIEGHTTSTTKFICNVDGCFKEFTKNRKLQNHLRLHLGERPFICDMPNCFKKYTNSSHLRRHIKTKHTENNQRIMCTVEGCGRELANKSCLKKHICRWHNPQRTYPFMCNECQQGFYRKKQLQQHSYLHTGELPFSCDQCGAKFLTTTDKNKHKRIHKKYSCECGNVCERWTTFLTHKRICKLKNFKCSLCNKIFSNKSNLKMHVNTHSDKKDRKVYICPYDNCGKYYFYKTNLSVHIKNNHHKLLKPKIPCSYEGCNKLLSKMQNYRHHLTTHEEINKPKFPRKPRKDKGKTKKKAIEELCGIACSDDNEKKNITIELNKDGSINSDNTVKII